MKILAIDQSLTETGYWIDNEINGTIKTNSKDNIIKRLIVIREKLKELLINENPNIVVMENYSFGSTNTKFTFTAGEVGGMIKLLMYDNNIEVVLVAPTLLKKYVCGKGNAKKEQILLQAYKRFNKEFSNNNLCDAFCLNVFYQNFLNNEVKNNNDAECFMRLKNVE